MENWGERLSRILSHTHVTSSPCTTRHARSPSPPARPLVVACSPMLALAYAPSPTSLPTLALTCLPARPRLLAACCCPLVVYRRPLAARRRLLIAHCCPLAIARAPSPSPVARSPTRGVIKGDGVEEDKFIITVAVGRSVWRTGSSVPSPSLAHHHPLARSSRVMVWRRTSSSVWTEKAVEVRSKLELLTGKERRRIQCQSGRVTVKL